MDPRHEQGQAHRVSPGVLLSSCPRVIVESKAFLEHRSAPTTRSWTRSELSSSHAPGWKPESSTLAYLRLPQRTSPLKPSRPSQDWFIVSFNSNWNGLEPLPPPKLYHPSTLNTEDSRVHRGKLQEFTHPKGSSRIVSVCTIEDTAYS
jgi:hypothetical protein